MGGVLHWMVVVHFKSINAFVNASPNKSPTLLTIKWTLRRWVARTQKFELKTKGISDEKSTRKIEARKTTLKVA